jgi:hypothetical protein
MEDRTTTYHMTWKDESAGGMMWRSQYMSGGMDQWEVITWPSHGLPRGSRKSLNEVQQPKNKKYILAGLAGANPQSATFMTNPVILNWVNNSGKDDFKDGNLF